MSNTAKFKETRDQDEPKGCPSRNPRTGEQCARPTGHDGDHVSDRDERESRRIWNDPAASPDEGAPAVVVVPGKPGPFDPRECNHEIDLPEPAPAPPVERPDMLIKPTPGDMEIVVNLVAEHGNAHQKTAMRRIIAALRQPSQPPETPRTWQPMSTAPKDGTFIVATDAGRVYEIEPHTFGGSGNGWGYSPAQSHKDSRMVRLRKNAVEPSVGGNYETATRWMPLPSPPSQKNPT